MSPLTPLEQSRYRIIAVLYLAVAWRVSPHRQDVRRP
jgi:hypothetical protein